MMRTGEMRKKVSIQKFTTGRGAEGGETKSWSEENEVWAKITPLSANERQEADKVKNMVSHRISMRYYSPGLTGLHQIVWNSRTFNIVAVVNPGERGCDTIVDAREEV